MFFTLPSLFALTLGLLPATALAQVPGPSDHSCDYYHELEKTADCKNSQYLRQAGELCEKYLRAESSLGSEIQEFFPKVRLCLQVQLAAVQGPDFCENLDQIAIKSHLNCYLENDFCSLGFASKVNLAWVMRGMIFKSPWRQTGHVINQSCQSVSN